jgi:uncharacterized protein
MINARCPICSKGIQIPAISDLPSFPFCSERCRLVDLGRWIDGRYSIPGPPATEKPDEGGMPAPEDASADS